MTGALHVTVERVVPRGTTWLGYGHDDEGRAVMFAGDWRPMRDIGAALEDGEEVEVDVPDCSVLARDPS